MRAPPVLRTARLLLRAWTEEDREPFARMGTDAEVMRHFPALLDRAQSDALVDRTAVHFEQHGFGPWAVEVLSGPRFVGFVGLVVPSFEAHFTPCVEIGWRLSRDAWGQGYATEAAREALRFGFEDVGLGEIVAMTVPENVRSLAVMERLGMTRDPADDFDHPRVPEGHRLRRHVLHRLSADAWRARRA
jgi:ribosomal-protein-alanine N-acetyltransferase